MTYPIFDPPDPAVVDEVRRRTGAEPRGPLNRIPKTLFLSAEVWPTTLELEFPAFQTHLFSQGHYLAFTQPGLDHHQPRPVPAFGLMLVRTTDWRDLIEIVRPQGFNPTGGLVIDVENVVDWLTGVSRDFHTFLLEEVSVSRVRGRFLERLPKVYREALASRILELCPWLEKQFHGPRDARFAGYDDPLEHFDLALALATGTPTPAPVEPTPQPAISSFEPRPSGRRKAPARTPRRPAAASGPTQLK